MAEGAVEAAEEVAEAWAVEVGQVVGCPDRVAGCPDHPLAARRPSAAVRDLVAECPGRPAECRARLEEFPDRVVAQLPDQELQEVVPVVPAWRVPVGRLVDRRLPVLHPARDQALLISPTALVRALA